jgi:DNA-binding response OmpR family regulator
MNKLVFIVEDNPADQKVLELHFQQTLSDYTVKTFSQPDDMLKHLNEKPSAIVLDHFFGSKSKTGLDYLKDLRKKYSSIPVIYYTTLDDESVRKEVLHLGAVQYIIKDSASLIRLRSALDALFSKPAKKGFLQKLFGR